MTNVYRLPEREAPTREACEWLARLDRGLHAQEEQDLRDWLRGDSRRAAALIEAARVWDRMDALSRLTDLFPQSGLDWHPRTGLRLAVAASLLCMVLAALFAARQPSTPSLGPRQAAVASVPGLRFETAVGEHSTTRLPDGSELTLNTNSRVAVSFDDRERRLVLEQGEVYVKVAHDAARPLRLFARDRVVQALGTEFNVEIRQDQQVEVIVTRGKVLIGIAPTPSSLATPAASVPGSRTVSAGQRVLLSQARQVAEPIDADEIGVKLSWRDGNLIFRGQRLGDALGEIERYTPVEFVITDERLKTIRVTGMFKAGDVDGLLETLRRNFNISHERVGAEKIVLKGP